LRPTLFAKCAKKDGAPALIRGSRPVTRHPLELGHNWLALLGILDDRTIGRGETVDEKVKEKSSGNSANDVANNGTNGRNGNGKDQSKFDWVASRSACTLPKVFAALRQQVEEDVKTRNSQRPNYAVYEYSVADDIDTFTVYLKAKDVSRSVSFKLSEHAIAVQDDQASSKFQVRLHFTDAGECRLRVDDQEREYWQIRRMALEDLMFRQE
jgi:hypothetical protein